MQTVKEAQATYEMTFSFDQLLVQALRLPPLQKVQLVEKLMGMLEKELESSVGQSPPRRSLHGMLAHLGPAPSAKEIDEARQEAWSTFPREDI
ncbi:MAG: hypothetical protein R3C14_25055 [Caldilineaceae bacterium]